MAEIVYPEGCPAISDELEPAVLIHRLKKLAHTLRTLEHDEGTYQQYIPLALYLAEQQFLSHPSQQVQLLIACCIADVLCMYVPYATYTDADQVKTIFSFFIKQLQGLKFPTATAFERCFYLLKNFVHVKLFNFCYELDHKDCQEIICALFSLMFEIVNDQHSEDVKSYMLDLLCPLVTENYMLSEDLLNIILLNFVEPKKSQSKDAYLLAENLMVKSFDTVGPYMEKFYSQKNEEFVICGRVYAMSSLLAALPQLECKLKSLLENPRRAGPSGKDQR